MRRIVCYWMILVLLIILLVILTWRISFSVPIIELSLDPLRWIWEHNYYNMVLYVGLILSIIAISILSFCEPDVIPFEAPLSQQGLFLYATAILLLAAFFLVFPEGESGNNGPTDTSRYIDIHPLIFYTAAFFLVMLFITGFVNTVKNHKLGRTDFGT